MRPLAALALPCLMLACAPTRYRAPAEAVPHWGPSWFAHRARSLGITAEAAVTRDATLAVGKAGEPPHDQLDEHTATEAAAIWRDACAQCHGPDGRPPPPLPGQAPARAWGGFGARMGFTFGGDAMRGSIYLSIADGKGDTMPAWRGKLSREQIWALVRHIESL